MTSPTMPLRTEGLLLSIDKEHYRVRYLFAWVLSLAFRVTAECGTLQEAILNIGSHLPIACPRDAIGGRVAECATRTARLLRLINV
jgi:hypothetical protein